MTLARIRVGGLTLIELLVALAIGALLIIAAVRIYAHGQTAYRAAESLAGVEETARYALTAVAYDVGHAGFWGLASSATGLAGRRADSSETEIAVGGDCAAGWASDVDTPVAATNNRYGWTCRPYRNQSTAGADTLTIRRAQIEPAAAEAAGHLYIRTTRFGRSDPYVAGPSTPSPTVPASPDSAIHELATRGYYVSPTSSLSVPGNAVPSLRIKRLTHGPTGPRVTDEEIYPGVEDMQVELGIDWDAPGTEGFGTIDAYVDPESPTPDGARILAVRIWLLVRALERESGFTASPRRQYADRVIAAGDDRYRRTLVTTTVRARNCWQVR